MLLTWHIAKKLLSRLWPWLALIAAVIATRYGLLWHFEHRLDIDRPLFDRTASIDSLLFLIQHLLLTLFVVSVVHEDSPLDDSAFWPTRPIAGLRLFAAKLIAIVLGAVLLPLAGILLWWWLHNFRLREIAASLPRHAIILGSTAAITFAVSIFNRTWMGFLVGFLTLFLLGGIGLSIVQRLHNSPDLTPTPFPLKLIALYASIGVVACTWQLYRHRNIRRTYTLLGITLGLCALIRLAFPLHAEMPDPLSPTSTPSSPGTDPIQLTAHPLHLVSGLTAPNPSTEWHARLPLRVSALPANHIPALRSARVATGSAHAATLRITATDTTNRFRPHPPQAQPEFYPFMLDLRNTPPFPALSAPTDSPAIPQSSSLEVAFLLRRITPVAALENTPGSSARSGPYRLRILAPSAPYRSKDSSTARLSRSVTTLLTHPAQLTAPGTGIAEYLGAPDDTDETGRHFDARATLFATLGGKSIKPVSAESSTITFTADGVFFVRRVLGFDPPPADVQSLKIHYVTYPATGTVVRTLALPYSPAL